MADCTFDPHEYVPTMARLSMLAGLLHDEPLADMLNFVEHTHAVGPILTPLEYRSGCRNLDDQRDLLEALLKVQRVVRRLAERDGVSHAQPTG